MTGPDPTLATLAIAPTSVTGGTSAQGTVALSAPAGTGGEIVTISSANPAVVSVPSTVTVAAGATSATFVATTTTVSASTPVVLTGAAAGVSQTATLTVTPATAPPTPPTVTLASLSLAFSSVTGGTSTSATATLSATAGTGGVVVTLSSTDSSVASVPGSVTVAAGATSATFTVATAKVSASTAVVLTGMAGGVSQTSTLTVTPASSSSTKIISLSGNLAFGTVPIGNNPSADLTIHNSGNTTLNVTSITISDAAFVLGVGDVPTSVLPGANRDVSIAFEPTLRIPYGATLTVASDATSGTNTYSLSGTGTWRTTFGAGTWIVGVDIQPGRYYGIITDPVHCSAARLDPEGRSLGAQGGIAGVSQWIFDILPSDFSFNTNNACGTWTNVHRGFENSSFTFGEWDVQGGDVQVGTYTSTTPCSVGKLLNFTNTFPSSQAGPTVVTTTITIQPSDVGVLVYGAGMGVPCLMQK